MLLLVFTSSILVITERYGNASRNELTGVLKLALFTCSVVASLGVVTTGAVARPFFQFAMIVWSFCGVDVFVL